ncbi:Ig-like domain-containing protein [Chitinimonas sp. BJB300]|uniref:Ig-like domain-containing protein n=1 Tax=Chitinimonas sp. BJB300 TaxID=1559339 RepID=UPI0013043EED|nr:Ig-like domain-containing protein [Chitinimonas sp. BJB300]
MLAFSVRAFLLCVCCYLLTACGGGAPASSSSAVTYQIALYADSNNLASDGQTSLALTAVVKDQSNRVVSGQTVSFSSDSGNLNSIVATTDASGTATALLSTAGDPANRTIVVTAQLGSQNAKLQVTVQGTSLAVSGNLDTVVGGQAVLSAVLTNSAGQPIANQVVNVTSSAGNPVVLSGPTDSLGRVSLTLTGQNTGPDTLTITALGAIATSVVTVNSVQSLSFTAPAAATDVLVGASQTLTAHYAINGTPQTGVNVNFAASRGILTSSTATTDTNGDVSTSFSSNSAGPVVVTASLPSGSTQLSFNVKATTPASIALQSTRSTLGLREETQLTATVRDANGNLVADQPVSFNIIVDSTGGSLSAALVRSNNGGQASITYTSGGVASGINGVTVEATVATSITSTTRLTVAQAGVAISLVRDNNLVLSTNPNFYSKQFTAIVTDSAGNPVSNQTVEFRVKPERYYKGFLVYDNVAGVWVVSLPSLSCAKEDTNSNDSLDAGEDLNGNGQLDPTPAETITRTAVSDSNGLATINLLYPRERADWLDVRIEAYAGSIGSNLPQSVRFFTLLPLVDDILDSLVPPPNVDSPFGTVLDCTSPN